jgi:hypothetical protein
VVLIDIFGLPVASNGVGRAGAGAAALSFGRAPPPALQIFVQALCEAPAA